MTRCLKSFIYTMLHDYVFYIMLAVVVFLSICTGPMNSEAMQNHRTVKLQNGESYQIRFEDEDPLLVAQNNMSTDTTVKSPIFDQSINNSVLVSGYLIITMVVLSFAVTVYQCIFCGRLFKDGTIRNLVVSGISKTKVFLSSFVISLLFLVLFTVFALLTTVLKIYVSGWYLIIYWPSFLPCVGLVALLLVLMVVGTLLFLFLSQNSMLTLILQICMMIALNIAMPMALLNMSMNDGGSEYEEIPCTIKMDVPEGVNPSTLNKDSLILKVGAKEYEIKERMYRDISSVSAPKLYYDDGQYIDTNDYSKPNPNYKGDTYHKCLGILLKGDVYSTIFYLGEFGYFAIARDGMVLTESLITVAYIAIMLAGGCIIAKKRNIN